MIGEMPVRTIFKRTYLTCIVLRVELEERGCRTISLPIKCKCRVKHEMWRQLLKCLWLIVMTIQMTKLNFDFI